MSNKYRRLPPLPTLVVFEAAHRLQSFTRAADEVALSPASVSRRIRELEEHLGTRLFDRRRYDVVPTGDGQLLAATVNSVLGELLATTDRIRKRSASINRLSIFSDISLANALIAPVLGEFQQLHPNIKLRVLSSSEPIEVIEAEFDIGLQYDRRAESRFTIEPIADDVIFPVCSPQRAASLPASPDPCDIAKQPLLHFSDPLRDWITWRSFLATLRMKEPEPIEGLHFSSYQMCLDVAERGEGIALGWGRSVKARLDAGYLVRIPGLTMPLPDSVNVYRLKNDELSSVAIQFISLLRNKIKPMD